MAYLKNQTINLLNLHYGLHALVLNGAGAFFAVFLLKAGVSTPLVFAAIAATLALRFAIRPVVLWLAPRFGLRSLVAFGTVVSAIQYIFLAEVRGADAMLLGFVISAAIGDVFYWTSYHSYFASLGDAEHRGHQIGAREALASITAILGPLIGGWVLTVYGPRAAFDTAAILQVFCALPFMSTPDVPIERDVPNAIASAMPGVLLFVADGVIMAGLAIAWQIALFLSLGESFTAYGGALALAGFAGAIAGLLLGRHIDEGHGQRAALLAFVSLVATILFRAMSTHNAALAVAANAMGAFVLCLYVPTLMTAVYNMAKHSTCTLRFHFACEGGWDFGGCMTFLTMAGLTLFGFPLSTCIALSLIGAVASLFLLRRVYGKAGLLSQMMASA